MKLPGPLTMVFLCTAVLLVVSLSSVVAATADTSAAGEVWTYFGTYTGPKSQGIYVSRLDLATGELTSPILAAEVATPSFVALHPNGHFLYAVNEVGDFQGKKSGAVTSFSIDRQTGKLTSLNQQPSGGDSPCHLNVDATGKALLVANYGGGSCAAFPIAPRSEE